MTRIGLLLMILAGSCGTNATPEGTQDQLDAAEVVETDAAAKAPDSGNTAGKDARMDNRIVDAKLDSAAADSRADGPTVAGHMRIYSSGALSSTIRMFDLDMHPGVI